MNSPEDTAWLSQETDEFLRLAIIWPRAMTKLMHLMGLLLSVGMVGGISNGWYVLIGFTSAGLLWATRKLSTYKKDIILISNEQSRRRQGE